MASSTGADTELLTEHFGYPPVSLLDDIINTVNILAERALNSVEQALLRQPPASLGFKPPRKSSKQDDKEAALAAAAEAHRLEVEDGTHQLETLLCASIDRNFDKFEIYVMRNILCVRPEDRDWMRLAHYEGLDFSAVSENDNDNDENENDNENDKDPPSDAAIARLHRRLQASLKLGSLLEAETARNEVVLTRLRTLAGRVGDGTTSKMEEDADPASSTASLAYLFNRGPLTESDVTAPLTTTTAFALSQLPALRQLSGELRHMAPGLAEMASAKAAGPDDDDNDGKSWRRERLEYVEGATRKHLERVRSLGLGRSGEGRGDDAQPPDKNGADAAVEPEALTNILSILREHRQARGQAAQQAEAKDAHDDEAMDES